MFFSAFKVQCFRILSTCTFLEICSVYSVFVVIALNCLLQTNHGNTVLAVETLHKCDYSRCIEAGRSASEAVGRAG